MFPLSGWLGATMRTSLLVLVLVASTTAHAQGVETLDVLQFRVPAGQRDQRPNLTAFTEVRGGSFCRFAVYWSTSGLKDPTADFQAEWVDLGKDVGTFEKPPKVRVLGLVNGWTRVEGTALARAPQVGGFRVRQATFSSATGRRSSAVAHTSDNGDCDDAVESFFASLAPAATTTAAAPAIPQSGGTASSGPPPALTARAWYRASASYSNWGFNPTGTEFAKAGAQGYASRTWTFRPDGTYLFRAEVLDFNRRPRDLFVTEESGRYRVEGDALAVTPGPAQVFLENRDTRARRDEQPFQSPPTTYRLRYHYLSGMADWYLILTPASGHPTAREGGFDDHPLFPGAYLYGKPSKFR